LKGALWLVFIIAFDSPGLIIKGANYLTIKIVNSYDMKLFISMRRKERRKIAQRGNESFEGFFASLFCGHLSR
jgi:hypothetical protein